MANTTLKFMCKAETKKCPRCRRMCTASGFRKNSDIRFDNEICWNCAKQVDYHTEQGKICENKLGISLNEAKIAVFAHYGAFCNCCGETEPKFLQIDHVKDDGAEHRQMMGKLSIYVWIVNNNFPDNVQILCANCNHGKYRNAGICPHKNILRLVINE